MTIIKEIEIYIATTIVKKTSLDQILRGFRSMSL